MCSSDLDDDVIVAGSGLLDDMAGGGAEQEFARVTDETARRDDVQGAHGGALHGGLPCDLACEDFAYLRERLEAFDEPELKDTPFFVP